MDYELPILTGEADRAWLLLFKYFNLVLAIFGPRICLKWYYNSLCVDISSLNVFIRPWIHQ